MASNIATNRRNGLNYDANGNWDLGTPSVTSYDAENRRLQAPVNQSDCYTSAKTWTYVPAGKRVIAFDPCLARQYPDDLPNYQRVRQADRDPADLSVCESRLAPILGGR